MTDVYALTKKTADKLNELIRDQTDDLPSNVVAPGTNNLQWIKTDGATYTYTVSMVSITLYSGNIVRYDVASQSWISYAQVYLYNPNSWIYAANQYVLGYGWGVANSRQVFLTGDLWKYPYATPTIDGIVSTVDQYFGGNKWVLNGQAWGAWGTRLGTGTDGRDQCMLGGQGLNSTAGIMFNCDASSLINDWSYSVGAGIDCLDGPAGYPSATRRYFTIVSEVGTPLGYAMKVYSSVGTNITTSFVTPSLGSSVVIVFDAVSGFSVGNNIEIEGSTALGGTVNIWGHITAISGSNVTVVFDQYYSGTGGTITSATAIAVTIYKGVTGTDAIGNSFYGGINTKLGSGGISGTFTLGGYSMVVTLGLITAMLAVSSFTATGTSTASFVGVEAILSSFTATGTSTASFVGAGLAGSSFVATGTSTASFVGASEAFIPGPALGAKPIPYILG